MKSLNIKIPLPIATQMDNNGHLNPNYLTGFIVAHMDCKEGLNPITTLSYNYTFKVQDDLHKAVKLKSIELDVSMNDFVGRLLEKHYKGGKVNG